MRYGIQLFSLRQYLKDEDGYREVFKNVKDMGAQVVQLSGGKPIPAKTIAAISQEYGLPICITHDKFDRIVGDIDGLIEEHKTYGCDRMGIGMMPKQFRTGELKDLEKFIDILNATADKLEKVGMTIAYHNHWFEFDRIEGKSIYDRIIDGTQKVEFIPDTFWIRFAGQSCDDYLKKLKGRVNTLHLKDYKKTLGIPVFRAVGKGVLDFNAILKTAEECGVENSVVELDVSPNAYKSMRFSMETIKRLGNAE